MHRLLLHVLLIAVSALLLGRLAGAQGLDQLAKPIVEAVKAAEQSCRAEGGEPDYAPFEMVRSFYMGAVGAGQEAFLIDFKKFQCIFPPSANRGADVECGSYGCRMALFLPQRRSQWVKVYDQPVFDWSVDGVRPGDAGGANSRLRLITSGGQCGKHRADECQFLYRADASKLVRLR
jgi:hypothetical protein